MFEVKYNNFNDIVAKEKLKSLNSCVKSESVTIIPNNNADYNMVPILNLLNGNESMLNDNESMLNDKCDYKVKCQIPIRIVPNIVKIITCVEVQVLNKKNDYQCVCEWNNSDQNNIHMNKDFSCGGNIIYQISSLSSIQTLHELAKCYTVNYDLPCKLVIDYIDMYMNKKNLVLPFYHSSKINRNKDSNMIKTLTTKDENIKYCYCNEPKKGVMISCGNTNCPFGKLFHLHCTCLGKIPEAPWYCTSACWNNVQYGIEDSEKIKNGPIKLIPSQFEIDRNSLSYMSSSENLKTKANHINKECSNIYKQNDNLNNNWYVEGLPVRQLKLERRSEGSIRAWNLPLYIEPNTVSDIISVSMYVKDESDEYVYVCDAIKARRKHKLYFYDGRIIGGGTLVYHISTWSDMVEINEKGKSKGSRRHLWPCMLNIKYYDASNHQRQMSIPFHRSVMSGSQYFKLLNHKTERNKVSNKRKSSDITSASSSTTQNINDDDELKTASSLLLLAKILAEGDIAEKCRVMNKGKNQKKKKTKKKIKNSK